MAFNENNEEYMEGFCTECCCTLYGDDAYDMFCDDCEAEQNALAREATFGGLITARESFLNNNSNVNPDLPYNEGGWMKSRPVCLRTPTPPRFFDYAGTFVCTVCELSGLPTESGGCSCDENPGSAHYRFIERGQRVRE